MRLGHDLRARALSTALLGAGASDPRTPFTEFEQMTAVAIGAPNIRYWADSTANTVQTVARRAMAQKGRPFVDLALSGGGAGFETDAMRQLCDYGYEKARSGAIWVTELSPIEAAKDAGGVDPSCMPRELDCIRPALNPTKDASVAP